MKTIAVINQKGGVAKTTTAHNIGAGLALRGRKILFIDLDPQCSLSLIVGANTEGITVLDVLTRKAKANEAIQRGSQFDIIAASEGLAADGILTATGKEYRLKEALQTLSGCGYEFVILDCPPSLGILTINALTAADTCLIPVQAETLSLQALRQIYPTIETIRTYTNKDLSVSGIIVTRYNGRAILSREAVEMIEAQAQEMGTKVYSAKIRESIAIKEAQAMHNDIFTYALRSNPSQDYQSLLDEMEL